MSRILMKGNEAVVYGALTGGATHFFGYPITPASEIAHAAALFFTASGRTFLQAESEIAAINMIYGASSAGARTMTATSGPGLSLMAEGLSYLAGAELPSVVVDVQRAGPGLGNIWPEQSDYNATVKGGGHGNYSNIVFAPNSAQEMCDMTRKAFELADAYRMTVIILSDAYIGQMMEPVDIPETATLGKRKDWAVYGDAESRGNLITSILMNPLKMSNHNEHLQNKYRQLEENCVEYEEYGTEDADIVLTAFGICSRLCHTVMMIMRKEGYKVGFFRPKTLFPFPNKAINRLADMKKPLAVVELNTGMMADDVELSVQGGSEILRYNWLGGIVPTVKELTEKVTADLKKLGKTNSGGNA
ncbi:MAG: 3-methyl-2-oxobutanoate dehydrogenase subunit VorB [Bacteroidetes bacterium]|nr:3-methyl-2-oxobutanoate dehydrogenase subunit VorB [Bacteroidota bacterium]